jgi:hypothetical protein
MTVIRAAFGGLVLAPHPNFNLLSKRHQEAHQPLD